MITVLVGENSFAIAEAIAELVQAFPGDAERLDGETVGREQLPELFGGVTLFASERLVIIRDLSKNTAAWGLVEALLGSVADSTQVVLVETKLDKRTTTYKALKKTADIREFPLWGERDRQAAVAWVSARAKSRQVPLTSASARHLVERVGLDQWQLQSALEKLSLLDEITPESIDEHIEAHPSENIFQLFELAVNGDAARVRQALRTLAMSEEAYAVFALLTSQVLQLAAISKTNNGLDVAKDFGIHPFVVSKMQRAARQLGPAGVRRVVQQFALTDRQLKSTGADPWLLVEKTLLAL